MMTMLLLLGWRLGGGQQQPWSRRGGNLVSVFSWALPSPCLCVGRGSKKGRMRRREGGRQGQVQVKQEGRRRCDAVVVGRLPID